MLDFISRTFTDCQAGLFEQIVQPTLFKLGAMRWQEQAYSATEWFLLGILQIALLWALLRPLEALFPAERWSSRRATKVDFLYTLLQRLGLIPLVLFFLLTPLFDGLTQFVRGWGFTPLNLDAIWPGVTDHPWISLALYWVFLDFLDYWLHRAQHYFNAWWALHAVHHAQQHMSLWTDDRNHVLDTFLTTAIKLAVALAIGVEPGQFVLIVIASRLLQNLQHANLRWSFGFFEKFLVSPRFHRHHHALGTGHEGAARGCNFGVLLPWWDMLFGTANFSRDFPTTGIRDQLPAPAGSARDYGEGFWAQQWLGLRRLAKRA
jgi:sterol desaturase/sphingolipid hydroxylase (fatty acid hydroxylase superfamily)